MPFVIPNSPDAANPDQAEPDKVDYDIVTAGNANVGVISGCAISQRGAGANMSVDFASGTVQVGSAIGTVTSGNVVVTTADATNPRFDLAVVDNAGTKSVTAGTASSNPVFPAVPANSVALAAIYVAAGVTSIVTANIVDKRVSLADYALLAGKAGGQTLNGGTAASEKLTLKATTNATRGTLELGDPTRLLSTGATYTAQLVGLQMPTAITHTLDFVNANCTFAQMLGTVLYEQAGWVGGAAVMVRMGATFKNPAAEANNLGSHFLFLSAGTYQADTQSITLNAYVALSDTPILGVASGGVLANANYETVRFLPTVNTGATTTLMNALHVYNPLGAGTITTLCALDIDDLTRGTTNLSLRSAGAAVQMRHAGPAVFGANAAPTNASVGLEVQSTTKALLLPRMTTTQRDALTALDGMMIYNTTTTTVQARVNAVWTTI